MLVSHLGINQTEDTAESKLPDNCRDRLFLSLAKVKRLLLCDFFPRRTQFNSIPDIDLDLGVIDLEVNSNETRSEALFIYIAFDLCLIFIAAIFVINRAVPCGNQIQICY